MKNLFPILYISSLCYSVSSYGIDENLESETPRSEENHLEEVAMLEPNFFSQQQPISREEFDLSPVTPRHKNSFLAVSLSFLTPGLGHAYLGDFKTAGSLFGSSCLFRGFNYLKLFKDAFYDINSHISQHTWFYGVYAAYRDVRTYNNEEGYYYKMPKDSFTDLAWAPFQWSVLKKPEVWGGFLGAFALGMGLQYFLFSKKSEVHLKFSRGAMYPLVAFPVGIGEESFCRGYLQSYLSEMFTPVGGIVISSLIFGAMHLPQTLFWGHKERRRYMLSVLPFITSFGAYFGWLTHKNHSLKESVAVHTWYDFAVFLVSYSAIQSAAIGKPSFAFSMPF